MTRAKFLVHATSLIKKKIKKNCDKIRIFSPIHSHADFFFFYACVNEEYSTGDFACRVGVIDQKPSGKIGGFLTRTIIYIYFLPVIDKRRRIFPIKL